MLHYTKPALTLSRDTSKIEQLLSISEMNLSFYFMASTILAFMMTNKFEIRFPLSVHLRDFFGYYNEFEIHKCLININSNE